jgi:hypothetical protein
LCIPRNCNLRFLKNWKLETSFFHQEKHFKQHRKFIFHYLSTFHFECVFHLKLNTWKFVLPISYLHSCTLKRRYRVS